MGKHEQKIPRWVWLLGAVVVVGIFFRVYNHHDFLRFNPDQSRDASLVRDVLNGKENWPLLGPQAGGTNFRLGGFFYQIEIVSGKIFGTAPDRLAFPDLFFSILSLPLLYFFLREFFSEKISLTVTGIAAVSFYAVKYARFAWNPNSAPFYVLLFLYASYRLAKKGEKRPWVWALLVGLSAGIGVQLHSLILFTFPFVFLAYFAYLFFKKNSAWKWAPLILAIGLLMNTTQIVSEFQTGGKNIQSFFQGMHKKSSRSGTLAQKFVLDAACHIQSNSFMILPIGNDSQCDFMDISNNLDKNLKKGDSAANFILLGDIVFALIFSLGGYFLLFQAWKKETDEDKKNFLGLIILYVGALFVLLWPLADEISFRFFLVSEFVPFLLLGFWLKYAQAKLQPKTMAIVVAIVVAIAASTNVGTLAHNFSYLSGHAKEGPNGFEEITLGEVRYMADFISTHGTTQGKNYLNGKPSELFKITKSIKYFTDQDNLKIANLSKHTELKPEDKVFAIDVVKDPAKKTTAPSGTVAEGGFGRVRIYEINH